jgi:hypothetical protein
MTAMTSDVTTPLHDPELPPSEPESPLGGDAVTAAAAPGSDEVRGGRGLTIAAIIVLTLFFLELMLLAAGLLRLGDPLLFLEPIVAP